MSVLRIIVAMSMACCSLHLMAIAFDGAPSEEAKVYQMDYRSLWIDNNGQPRYLNSSDNVEVVYDTDIKVFINGLIPWIGYEWIEGESYSGDDFVYFQSGSEIGKIKGTGDSLYLYHANLKKDANGDFSIIPVIDADSEICLKGKNDSGLTSFNYESNSGYDGIGVFYKDNNNELLPYNNCMLVKGNLVSTEEVVYYPPVGSDVKRDEIIYYSLDGLDMIEGGKEDPEVIGKLINAVYTDDAIYLNGLFTGTKYNWVKGELNNGKAIFKRGQTIGAHGLHLGVYRHELSMPVEFTPIDSDLVFEYDSETGRLHSPNGDFMAREDVDEKIYLKYPSKEANWNEIYFNALIERFNDNEMTPSTPGNVSIINSYDPNAGGDVFYLSFQSSYFSEHGVVMDTDKLYYRIVCNGETYELDKSEYDLEESMLEIPYLFEHYNGLRCMVAYSGHGHSVWIPEYLKNSEWGVELIYYGGDKKTMSGIGYTTSGVYEINGESSESNTFYDLSGRMIDKTNASPGIYISKGEKIILK